MMNLILTSTLKTLTSFEGTLEPFLRVHQVSTVAIRQESTTPAASTKKTPAKLWMSKALPVFRVPTGEYRSHGLSRGHHFSFRMSMSPFCWSSKILDTAKYRHTNGRLFIWRHFSDYFQLTMSMLQHLSWNKGQEESIPSQHKAKRYFKRILAESVMVWISETVCDGNHIF